MSDASAAVRFPDWTLPVTPDSVCRWYVGRDGRLPDNPPQPGDRVPLSYLFFLRCQPALGLSTHTLLGRDPDRGLFGAVRYRRSRSIRIGETLSASAVITDRKNFTGERGDMVISTLVTDWKVDSKTAVAEEVQLVDLPPGPVRSPRPGPSANSSLEPLGEPLTFTPTQIAWLAVETGDWNPLHFDREYAKKRGFADIVVPGTLIVPAIERTLGKVLPDPIACLDVRFRAPTYPGEYVRIRTRRDQEHVHQFEVESSGHVRAFGEVATAVEDS